MTATQMQYTLVRNEEGTSNLTVYVPGEQPRMADSTNPNWERLLQGVLSNDDSVLGLFDVSLLAAKKLERLTERLLVANGRLYFDGEEAHSVLAEQIVAFVAEGVEDWKPLALFYENIMANPSNNSRKMAFEWLSAAKLTITDEGYIVGYKGVKTTKDKGVYLSTRAGNAISDGVPYKNAFIPNKLGTVVEMPRSEVVDNPSELCSIGLHIGTFSFAKGYGNVVLEVSVNPCDVVSVPASSGEKMRVCRYVPVKVLDKPYDTAVKPAEKPAKGVKASTPAVKVGDVYQDTDKRRADRTFEVEKVEGSVAVGKSMPLGITRAIQIERLQSRKYKLVPKAKSGR